MKIKTKISSFEKVNALPRERAKRPKKPSLFLASLIRLLSIPELKSVHFSYRLEGMKRIPKEPVLILMNHSSFIDLMIAYRLFYPRRFGIVCTSDGFVGKDTLMRVLGCIPTQKFVSDFSLIGDMKFLLKKKKSSVLMFPEASYSFDGTATPLPRGLGVLLKRLRVPVIMVKTEGAFHRDPLYNGLQKRKVNVSATVSLLCTAEEVAQKTTAELDKMLDKAFTFDHFQWQKENKIAVSEPFRADFLERILYQCPHCGAEGEMQGKGTRLFCHACGKVWEMTEYGELQALDGETEFSHIPDWFSWERDEVRRSLLDGTYLLQDEVEIGMMVNHKAIYRIGTGNLCHTAEGFHLVSFDSSLDYRQDPLSSYGLYADYFWYEIGDVICIGDKNALFYCFPKGKTPVAKARLAAEELYKIKKTNDRFCAKVKD